MVSLEMPELTDGSPWLSKGQLQSIKVNPRYGCGHLFLARSFQNGITVGVQNFFLYGEGKIRIFSKEKVNPPVISFAIHLSSVMPVPNAKPRGALGNGLSYIELPGDETNLFMDVESNTPIRSLTVCVDAEIFSELTGKSCRELAEDLDLLNWHAKRRVRPKRMESLGFAQKLCCREAYDSFMNNPHDLLFLKAKALELVALQLRQLDHLTGKTPQRQGIDPHAQKIRHACEILKKEMVSPPKKMELARRVGLNDKMLIQGFKDMFGVCPFEYLRIIRLEKARDLIAGHECNVTQAAYSVGYSSLSHFTKTFREKFGINPKALAKNTSI